MRLALAALMAAGVAVDAAVRAGHGLVRIGSEELALYRDVRDEVARARAVASGCASNTEIESTLPSDGSDLVSPPA